MPAHVGPPPTSTSRLSSALTVPLLFFTVLDVAACSAAIHFSQAPLRQPISARLADLLHQPDVDHALTLILGFIIMASAIGTLLNAATLAMVCRQEMEPSVVDFWFFFQYLCMAGSVLTLFLLPFGFYIYLVNQLMKDYVRTFGVETMFTRD